MIKLLLSIHFILAIFFHLHAQEKVIEQTLLYPSNVYELSNDQKVKIEMALDVENIQRIELYGHADTVGNIKANQKISEQRVTAVKDYILSNHSNLLIVTKANGEKLAQEHHTLSDQRRVDIRIFYEVIEKKSRPDISIKPKDELNAPKKIEIVEDPKTTFNETFMSSERIVIENLLFEPGKTEFLHGSIPNELFYLADLMDSVTTLTIHIEGHVCCVDDMKLSKERAKTVYLFLRGHGIDKYRMTFEGYSNKRPRIKELTPEDQKYNRRVEIVITSK